MNIIIIFSVCNPPGQDNIQIWGINLWHTQKCHCLRLKNGSTLKKRSNLDHTVLVMWMWWYTEVRLAAASAAFLIFLHSCTELIFHTALKTLTREYSASFISLRRQSGLRLGLFPSVCPDPVFFARTHGWGVCTETCRILWRTVRHVWWSSAGGQVCVCRWLQRLCDLRQLVQHLGERWPPERLDLKQ